MSHHVAALTFRHRAPLLHSNTHRARMLMTALRVHHNRRSQCTFGPASLLHDPIASIEPTPSQINAMGNYRANQPSPAVPADLSLVRQLGAAAPCQPWYEMPLGPALEEIRHLTALIIDGAVSTNPDDYDGRDHMQQPRSLQSVAAQQRKRMAAYELFDSIAQGGKRACVPFAPAYDEAGVLDEFRRFLSEV